MSPELAVGLVLGGAVGIALGRVWAENARARHDMKKTWRDRRDYRK